MNQPDVLFVVASDNPRSMDLLRRRFGSRILTPARRYIKPARRGARRDQMRLTPVSDAVLDLYVLSRCRCILGTRLSSFSQLAARLGGVELETMPHK